MDIHLRYWDKDEKKIATKDLTFLYFATAKPFDIKNIIWGILDNEKFELSWSNFSNISSDGPNINKAGGN